MYKSRAIPTLSGENAEYFREIQVQMEQTGRKENWQSVGEGVHTMMNCVINTDISVDLIPKSTRNKLNRKIPYAKQRDHYPAVLIGQIAVFDAFAKIERYDPFCVA